MRGAVGKEDASIVAFKIEVGAAVDSVVQQKLRSSLEIYVVEIFMLK
jgi:hypothetical protein